MSHGFLPCLLLSAGVAAAQMTGWKALDPSKPNEWTVVRAVTLDSANPKSFRLQPGTGALVNGKTGRTVNLITEATYGDVEAELEFIVSKDSNSGVYFQGLYEVQILDSYGHKELKYGDCGGIYARYINNQVVGGTPPRVNASRAPGEWQSFHIWFRAPRFSGGRKTEKARFLKVEHNGIVIHENVEVEGPTRASMDIPEGPTGPFMLQGDHGPVAFRNIRIRPLR